MKHLEIITTSIKFWLINLKFILQTFLWRKFYSFLIRWKSSRLKLNQFCNLYNGNLSFIIFIYIFCSELNFFYSVVFKTACFSAIHVQNFSPLLCTKEKHEKKIFVDFLSSSNSQFTNGWWKFLLERFSSWEKGECKLLILR